MTHWRAPHTDDDHAEMDRDLVFFLFGAMVGCIIGFGVGMAHAQSLTGADASGNITVTTVSAGCALASFEYGTDKATIDWACVDKSSRGELGEYNRQIAAILKAAREAGKADK